MPVAMRMNRCFDPSPAGDRFNYLLYPARSKRSNAITLKKRVPIAPGKMQAKLLGQISRKEHEPLFPTLPVADAQAPLGKFHVAGRKMRKLAHAQARLKQRVMLC